MPIRLLVLTLLMLALGAAPALAMDIQGKWGLGVGAAGVVGTNPDITLFYGRSRSSAWLLDVQLSGANLNGHASIAADTTYSSPTHDNLNQLTVNIAPGLRHFMRPEGEFSPYFDISAGGFYNHAHQYVDFPGSFTRVNRTIWQLGISCALGAEYFTPWHFSVAAHTGLASVNWFSNHDTFEPSGGGTYERNTSGVRANVGISPVLALRVYF